MLQPLSDWTYKQAHELIVFAALSLLAFFFLRGPLDGVTGLANGLFGWSFPKMMV